MNIFEHFRTYGKLRDRASSTRQNRAYFFRTNYVIYFFFRRLNFPEPLLRFSFWFIRSIRTHF